VLTKDHPACAIRPCAWPTALLNEGYDLARYQGVAEPSLGSDLSVIIQNDMTPSTMLMRYDATIASRKRTTRTIGVAAAVAVVSTITATLLPLYQLHAQDALSIDLRQMRRSETVLDETGEVLSRRYKTPKGIVTITRSRTPGTRYFGAIAKLEETVIARARVLNQDANGTEIEEQQFAGRDASKAVYVGRVRFSSIRDRVVSSTRISGTKLYDIFVTWDW